MSIDALEQRLGPHWSIVLSLTLLSGTVYCLFWSRRVGRVIAEDGGTTKTISDYQLVGLGGIFITSVLMLLINQQSHAVYFAAALMGAAYVVAITFAAVRIAYALENHIASKYGKEIRFNRLLLCIYHFPYISYQLANFRWRVRERT